MSDLPPPPSRMQSAVAGPSGLRRARSPVRDGAAEPPAQRQRAMVDQEVVLRTDAGRDFDLHLDDYESAPTPPNEVHTDGSMRTDDNYIVSVAVSLREQEVIRAHSADLVRAVVPAGVIPQHMSFRAVELLLDGRWVSGAVHFGGDQAVGVEFTFTRNEGTNSVPRSTSHRVVVPGGLIMPRRGEPQHPAARRIVWYLNITQFLGALLLSYSIGHRVFRRSLGVGLRWPSLPW